MNKIKTVAILGSGAVGAYFIWGSSKKLGNNLWVIADGERRKRLEQNGININGEKYSLNLKTPKEAKGVDLLLVAVKYPALGEALSDIAEIVDDNTIVLSLMNGVNSEEIIGSKIGMEHMLYSMIKISSERTENNILFNGETTPGLYYGEAGQPEPSERMLAVKTLLDETPIHYHMSKDIITDIWEKFAINVSYNLPQAILGCGVGAYSDSIYAANIFKRLREEVVAVAAAKGITISPQAENFVSKGINSKAARYSTLQDLDAKRHTEIDMFAGAVVEMGKELGIPTPYNEIVYNVIKAIEEKNDGKFDYKL
ncbi:MAG: ketopantoate reductase family protein [Oscillospiraceae bacterium]|nr:ketopantoate reductase family protein [Oscillospiraceae bacterium]